MRVFFGFQHFYKLFLHRKAVSHVSSVRSIFSDSANTWKSEGLFCNQVQSDLCWKFCCVITIVLPRLQNCHDVFPLLGIPQNLATWALGSVTRLAGDTAGISISIGNSMFMFLTFKKIPIQKPKTLYSSGNCWCMCNTPLNIYLQPRIRRIC